MLWIKTLNKSQTYLTEHFSNGHWLQIAALSKGSDPNAVLITMKNMC